MQNDTVLKKREEAWIHFAGNFTYKWNLQDVKTYYYFNKFTSNLRPKKQIGLKLKNFTTEI